MSLYTELAQFANANADMDEHQLAVEFVAAHTKAELVPLFAEEFQHVRRASVRTREVAALAAFSRPRAVVTVESISTQLGPLADLLDANYRIGDGRDRRAGEMTLDEWEVRRSLLAAQRNGIDRAIRVCDEAIAVLQRTGCMTLDEVGVELLQPIAA